MRARFLLVAVLAVIAAAGYTAYAGGSVYRGLDSGRQELVAAQLTIKNAGQAEHNFSIASLHVNQDIDKGESKTVTFTPTQAGSIEFFCVYHKVSKGMTGTVTVT